MPNKIPPCPMCGTNRQVNEHGRDEFFCGKCRGLFDSNPDEGGTYSDRNPSVRLEREERAQQRRRQPTHNHRY